MSDNPNERKRRAAATVTVLRTIATVVIALVFAVWDTWFIVVAFAGGQFPVPWTWTTDGSFWGGIGWLVIGSGVFYGAATLVVALLVLLITLPFSDILSGDDE